MRFLLFFSLLFNLAYAGDDKDVDEALAQKIISKNCDVNMQRSEIQELLVLSRTFTCSKSILLNFVTINMATSEVAQFSLSAKNEKGYSVVLIEMEEQLYSQPLEKIIAKTKKKYS